MPGSKPLHWLDVHSVAQDMVRRHQFRQRPLA